jgi:hypothetical protein
MSGDHNMFASGSGDGQRSGWRKRTIMEMAREAGLIKTIDCCGVPDKFCGQDQWKGDLKAFANLVREDERERIKDENQRCYVARGNT